MNSEEDAEKDLETAGKEEKQEAQIEKDEKRRLKENMQDPSRETEEEIVEEEEAELEELQDTLRRLEDSNKKIRKDLTELKKELNRVVEEEKTREEDEIRQIRTEIKEMTHGGGITEQKEKTVAGQLEESLEEAEKILEAKEKITEEGLKIGRDEVYEAKEIKRAKELLIRQIKETKIGEQEAVQLKDKKWYNIQKNLEKVEKKEAKELREVIEHRKRNEQILAEIAHEIIDESKIFMQEMNAILKEDLGLAKMLRSTGNSTTPAKNIQEVAEKIEKKAQETGKGAEEILEELETAEKVDS